MTFFYGLYLYVIPILGFLIKSGQNIFDIISGTRWVIQFSIVANFILATAQTVFQVRWLYSAGFGEGLYSSDGVQRATGTFSSAAGFGIYISIVFFYLISLRIQNKTENLYIFWVLFALMVVMSGSRTIIFNLSFTLVSFMFFTNSKIYRNAILFKILPILVVVTFISVMTEISDVARSGVDRFLMANSIDPPLGRLWKQILIPLDEMNFVGSGLSTRALGSVLNSDSRITFSSWIEFDNLRIVTEAGIIFLILIWVTKILIVGNSLHFISNSSGEFRAISFLLLVTYLPYLIFGQAFGQTSIASGTFFLAYLTFRSGERRNE